MTIAISEQVLPPNEDGPIQLLHFDTATAVFKIITDQIPEQLLKVKMNAGEVKIKDRCRNTIRITGFRPIAMMMLEGVGRLLKFRVDDGEFCGLLPDPPVYAPRTFTFRPTDAN